MGEGAAGGNPLMHTEERGGLTGGQEADALKLGMERLSAAIFWRTRFFAEAYPVFFSVRGNRQAHPTKHAAAAPK